MRYLSVCSGIEAATVAWHPLGWEPVAFSEIEPFPSSLLAHHYPSVSNWGDMTKFAEWPDAAVDVLVGGTPCQSFSVAGLRKGLADPRGNLMLTYLAIADKYRPEWLVWENVPGVLSSGEGRDFGALLGGLAELGHGFAYRVLDAQYYGVAQRRRRVFVVANAGSWRRAAAVLFERASLRGASAPSREAREDPAGSTRESVTHCVEVEPTLGTCGASSREKEFACNGGLVTHSLRASGFDASEDGTGRGTPLVPVAFDWQGAGKQTTLGASVDGTGALGSSKVPAVAQPYTLAIRGRGDSHNLEFRADGTANALLTPNGGRGGIGVGAVAFQESEYGTAEYDITGTQRANRPGHTNNLRIGMQVRRLTPRECERLQGFPDDYTAVPHRGKPAADGPRYKALGNSMAVPVMAWIGRRIQQVADVVAAHKVAA